MPGVQPSTRLSTCASGVGFAGAVGPVLRQDRECRGGCAVTPAETPPPPSPMVVWEHISTDKPFEDLTGLLRPDLHQWAADTWHEYNLRYIDLETVIGDMYRQTIERTGSDAARDVFLAEVKQRPEVGMWRYLMLMFDHRDDDLAEAIWQALKPEDSSR